MKKMNPVRKLLSGIGELGDHQIHAWKVRLQDMVPVLDHLSALLCEDETDRAGRFRFERDRQRYVISRGILRELLSAYSGVPARELSFGYGDWGKPHLADMGVGIEFNLSHSGGLCVLAFSRGVAVGVDIEAKKREVAFLELANRFFAPIEARMLRSLPSDGVPDAFYRVWTGKEAYIKALGEGVRHGLDNFSVSVTEDGPIRIKSERDPEVSDQWDLISFEPDPGFAGALAVAGKGYAMEMLQLDREHRQQRSAPGS